MWIEAMFYLVFLGQVVLISYIYPRKILSRMEYIFKHYPADKYAKLYADGFEKACQRKNQYKLVNNIILLLGLAIVTVLVVFSFQRNTVLTELDSLPFGYGIVQAIPFIMLELSALKQFRMMRQHNLSTKRQAELSPRSLFHYVSPIRVLATVFAFVVSVYLILHFNDFELTKTTATLIGAMLLCNGLFFGFGYRLLKGKKLDPYQSAQDRKNMTTGAFLSYTAVSILVSVFFILNQSITFYSLHIWEPMMNSLYWQAVMLLSTGTMLKSMPLEHINFDVYKTSGTSSGPLTNS